MKKTTMNPTNKHTIAPHLEGRLAAYAVLAGVALSAPVVAKAAIVESGPVNINIPNTFAGVYINLLTGATGITPAAVPGWDIGPWGSSNLLSFFWNGTPANTAGGVAGTTTGPYLDLALGSFVSGASVFTASAASAQAAAFQTGGTHFLGFRFLNEATGIVNFGYAQFSTTDGGGFPATLVRYAYENTGAGITVVPEPSTFALFGVMAAGALGIRVWRSRKAA